MKRFLILTLLTFVVRVPFADTAGKPASSGKWELYQNETKLVVEEYTTTETKTGFSHNSKVTVFLGESPVVILSTLEMSADFVPQSYSLDAKISEENKQTMSIRFGEESLSVKFRAGEETTEKTVNYTEIPMVLANNTMSHLSFIVRKYKLEEKEGKRAFVNIFSPNAMQNLASVMEYEGVEEETFNNKKILLHKSFINLGGMIGMNIFYDADGEPVKVIIPAQPGDIVRAGYEPKPVPPPQPQPETKEETPAPQETSEEQPESEEVTPPAESSAQAKFIEKEVFFSNKSVALAGTLTIPSGKKKYPAIILVSGSGPQDRDANSPRGGLLSTSFFKIIAEKLSAEADYIVLRYDDRGAGKSEGSLATASLTDLVQDVEAGIRFLQKQKEVDKNNIALLGHSEGGVIGIIVASKEKTPLSRLVLLGTPAKSMKEVLREQLELVPAGELRDHTRKTQDELFALADSDAETGTLYGQPLNLKWWREHFAVNPQELAKKIKIPTLIIQARQDRQVYPSHANILYETLNAVKTPASLEIFSNLDHLFLPTKSGSVGEYGRLGRKHTEEPFKTIAGWLKEGS